MLVYQRVPTFTPYLCPSFVGVHIPAPWFASGRTGMVWEYLRHSSDSSDLTFYWDGLRPRSDFLASTEWHRSIRNVQSISPDFDCEGLAMSFGTHVISSKSTVAMSGGIQGQILIDMSNTTAYWMEKKSQYTREFWGLYDIRGMEL